MSGKEVKEEVPSERDAINLNVNAADENLDATSLQNTDVITLDDTNIEDSQSNHLQLESDESDIDDEEDDNISEDDEENESVQKNSIARKRTQIKKQTTKRGKPKEASFTSSETSIIKDMIISNYETIHGFLGGAGRSADGKKSRDRIFELMASKCNEVQDNIRTPSKCHQKVKNIIKKVKSYSNKLKKEKMKTGGGIPENVKETAFIKEIYNRLSLSPRINGIKNGLEVCANVSSNIVESSETINNLEPPKKKKMTSYPPPRRSSSPIIEDSARERALVADASRSLAQERAAIAEERCFIAQERFWRKREESESLWLERFKQESFRNPIVDGGSVSLSSSSSSRHPSHKTATNNYQRQYVEDGTGPSSDVYDRQYFERNLGPSSSGYSAPHGTQHWSTHNEAFVRQSDLHAYEHLENHNDRISYRGPAPARVISRSRSEM